VLGLLTQAGSQIRELVTKHGWESQTAAEAVGPTHPPPPPGLVQNDV